MHRGIPTVWYNPPISQGVFSGNLGSQLPERFLGNWEVGKSNLDSVGIQNNLGYHPRLGFPQGYHPRR